MVEQLKEDLIALRGLREKRETAKNILQMATEEFKTTYAKEISAIEELGQEITDSEDLVRARGLRIYNETQNKTIGHGVKARILKKTYYEQEKAFTWAKEHQMALKLDVKVFEKLAKADNIDFVEIIDKVQITIPKEIEG